MTEGHLHVVSEILLQRWRRTPTVLDETGISQYREHVSAQFLFDRATPAAARYICGVRSS